MLLRFRQKPHAVTKADLDDALATVASFQGYVQHADGKVGTLVVLHAGAAATVASQASVSARLGPAGAVIGTALLGLFLFGFLVSGYHMLQVIRPVLRSPAIRSRYGITGTGNRVPSAAATTITGITETTEITVRIAEARALAELLAEIAERKYRHVAKAVPWTGLMLGAAICWLILVAAWR